MFSVTNSGSNIRLTSGDQVKITARVTPTIAPSAKPPRISTAVTARLENQAYFGESSVARVASGEGSMNVGTWKASTSTCHSTITARCTIRMIAMDRADHPPPDDNQCSLCSPVLKVPGPRTGPLNLPSVAEAFNHPVD